MKKTFTYLLAIAAFMLFGASAIAQGGSNPFTGSIHGYKVVPGDGANTLTWSVSPGTDGTEFDILAGAGTDSITIQWNTAGTYTLQLEEDDGTCTTVKELEIVVIDNVFDVTISDSTIACNAADGVVNFDGTDTTSLVAFTVDTVGVDWDHDWEITFTLGSASGATLDNVAASFGTLTGAGTVGDPYVLTNIPGAQGSVDITLEVSGNAFAQQTVEMEIVSAKELKYSAPALLNENTQSTSIVDAIPNTSDIQFN